MKILIIANFVGSRWSVSCVRVHILQPLSTVCPHFSIVQNNLSMFKVYVRLSFVRLFHDSICDAIVSSIDLKLLTVILISLRGWLLTVFPTTIWTFEDIFKVDLENYSRSRQYRGLRRMIAFPFLHSWWHFPESQRLSNRNFIRFTI